MGGAGQLGGRASLTPYLGVGGDAPDLSSASQRLFKAKADWRQPQAQGMRRATRLRDLDVMLKTITKLLKDESGASAAEYALILAIVGTGIAAGAAYLGGQISRALNGAGDKVCEAPSGGTTICKAAP